jgi:hypothetical protein
MGDILGSVLGGGQRTSQQTEVDPTSQALNRLRQEQLGNVFGQAGGDVYGGPSDAYTPSGQVQDLYNFGLSTGQDPANAITLKDYQQTGSDFLNSILGTSGAAAWDTTNLNLGTTTGNYQDALSRSAQGREGAMQGREADYARSYSDLVNAGSNYLNRIAAPTAMQAAALQGMEGSGAVPTAIANASAQFSGPAMQQLVGQYMQAGLDINQAANAAQAQLGSQYMGQQAATLGDYGKTQASLFGQGMQSGNQFIQSLPGASQTLSMIPEQQRALRAQTAGTLFPMADYARGLREQELAGRRGMFQTALTGIPYTPETTTKGRQSQQPLFNFFGQG